MTLVIYGSLLVKLALFEYELSCGFDWTEQEQQAIADLERMILPSQCKIRQIEQGKKWID